MQERRGRDTVGGRADMSLSDQRAGAGPVPGKHTLVEGLHASGGGAQPMPGSSVGVANTTSGQAAGAATGPVKRGVGGKRRAADGDRLRRLFGPQAASIGSPAPSAGPLARGLANDAVLSRPNDLAEREADHIADQFMRGGPVAAPAVGAAPEVVHRKCAACAAGTPCGGCGTSNSAGPAQPEAASPADAMQRGAAPTTTSAVVGDGAGGGQPMADQVRATFERGLGQDLGDVRIHTDAGAAASAERLGADAYTVGNDVVFAQGHYDPQSSRGKRLLAHELAHVMQHRKQPQSKLVSRFVPEADVEVEEEALELPGGVRYASPYNNSIEALMWRDRVRARREHAIFEAQRPILTVDRGGTAPNFVTVINTGHASAMGEDDGEVYSYDYDYEVRALHSVSALEYDVAHAHTAGQLASIYDSWFGFAMGFGGRLWNVSIPSGTDLRMQLMPFFMRAARTKAAAEPALAESPLMRALKLTYVGEEAVREGPCQTRNLSGHLGGNTEHNNFATMVTGGNPNDFEIISPEGWKCTTDGRDMRNPNVVWEVKVGHDWTSDSGLARGSIDSPRLHTWMLSLESQRIQCAIAAARCGYQYRYAVDNYEVAEGLNAMWNGNPRVYCFNHDGTPCRH